MGFMIERTVTIHSAHELGEVLRRVRKESGLSQRTSSGLCNVSLPFLNQIEQGKPTAQVGKVLHVCQQFGIEVVLKLPQLDR